MKRVPLPPLTNALLLISWSRYLLPGLFNALLRPLVVDQLHVEPKARFFLKEQKYIQDKLTR